VNTIRGIDEELVKVVVVQKVLGYLHESFNPKALSIEEITNMNTLTRDQLLGILIAYDLRNLKGKSPAKE